MLTVIGLDPFVTGNQVWLAGGGVQIAGPCSGKDMISQLLAAALIFVLAFPLKKRWLSYVVLAAAPLIAVISNGGRIAALAIINASAINEKKWWFDFFHEAEGSLVFAGIAMSIFAVIYLKLIDRQISKKGAAHA